MEKKIRTQAHFGGESKICSAGHMPSRIQPLDPRLVIRATFNTAPIRTNKLQIQCHICTYIQMGPTCIIRAGAERCDLGQVLSSRLPVCFFFISFCFSHHLPSVPNEESGLVAGSHAAFSGSSSSVAATSSSHPSCIRLSTSPRRSINTGWRADGDLDQSPRHTGGWRGERRRRTAAQWLQLHRRLA